ncbi:MAG: threonine synthase [Bacteroidetes bacterium]|nr:threonine synthase [Bacteroidota bacterium]
MQYYSLAGQAPAADFRTATLKGQAPDRGLYFPSEIPRWGKAFLEELPGMARDEMALRVMEPYVGDNIPSAELHQIVHDTLDFPIPLVPVGNPHSCLELFHGPTLAFKDVGARFMSRCLGWFASERGEKMVVLVATSGDTGGAVAHGFHRVPGIEVVILYPCGKVSTVQEKQLTTLGENIHALEVLGDFDDCQRLVKQAFADSSLQSHLSLSSANSINVARWLPQQLYYILAWQQWTHRPVPPVISVPSGNFGNLCAGMMAWRSGLPVARFIAACNANATVPRFIKGNGYRPQKSIATYSNAMDVADPSNFIRILNILGHSPEDCQIILDADSITDEETLKTIQQVYHRFGYWLDPHGAVGYLALQRWMADHPSLHSGYFLGTAHPVKFPSPIEIAIGTSIPMPEQLQALMSGEKKTTEIPAQYEEVRDFLKRLR